MNQAVGGSWTAALGASALRRAVTVLLGVVAVLLPAAGASAVGGAWAGGGPPGGMVQALVVDPTDPQVLFVGTGITIGGVETADVGVHRSLDGGESWSRVLRTPANEAVYALAVAPDGGAVYAGLEDGSVQRSLDSGASWEPLGTGLPEAAVTALAVSDTGDTVIAGTSTGEVLTHQPGAGSAAAWTDITADLDGSTVHALAAGRTGGGEGRVYAGTDQGLHRRVGGLWVRADPVAVPDGSTPARAARAVVLDPADAAVVHLAHDGADPGDDGVSRSTDSGSAWTSLDGGSFLASNPRSLALDPADATTLYGGTLLRVLRFESVATTPVLTQLTDGLPSGGGVEFTAVVSAPAPTPGGSSAVHVGSYSRGLYRSEDGGDTWQRGTLQASRVSGLAVAADDRVLASVADPEDLFSSGDQGQTWAPEAFAATAFGARGVVAHPTDAGLALLATSTVVLRRTDPDGSFTTVLDADDGLGSISPRDLKLDPGSSGRPPRAYIVPVVLGVGLILSEEDETTALGDPGSWRIVGTGFPAGVSPRAAAHDPDDPETFYASGPSTIHRLDDDVWTEVGSAAGVTRLLVVDGVVLGAGASGLVRSADRGVSWEAVAGGLAAGPVSDVVADPLIPGRVYALLPDAGVYRSDDLGLTWEEVGDDLPVSDLRAVRISATNPQRVHVATGGGGVFTLTLPVEPDGDGDGLIDLLDACPGEFGTEPDGCPPPPPPDGDGDGIPDTTDACPGIAGVAPDGCPGVAPPADGDGDGVPDAS
ncbi:MAG: hypothetical protein RJQ03_11830, partial [Miltoncostaeaceae bacterium]